MPEIKTKQSDSSKNFEVHTIPKKFLSMRPPSTFYIPTKGASELKSDKASQKKPTSKSKSGLKKNLIIGIIVIVVLGAAMIVAAWFFLRSVNNPQVTPPAVVTPPETKPEPEPEPEVLESITLDTAKWVTYNNSLYQYIIKYPTEFKNTLRKDAPAASGVKHELVLATQSKKAQLVVTVFIDNDAGSLHDWANKKAARSKDLHSFTLSNIRSYKYDNDESQNYTIYSKLGDYFYSLTFNFLIPCRPRIL